MDSFGQKLRQALEVSGLRLEQVADATGLGVEQIAALQRDDFAGLPGEARMDAALRSLAELVDVNPDEVISDYRRGRPRGQAAAAEQAAPVETVTAREAGSNEPAPPARRGGRKMAGTLVGLVAVATLAAVTVVWLRSTDGAQAPTSRPVRAQPVAASPASPRPAAPLGAQERQGDAPIGGPAGSPSPAQVTPREPGPVEPVPAAALPVPDTDDGPRPAAPAEGAGAASLSVTSHGVGRGVSDHRLVGEADSFREGSEVWFWTRVEDGAAGDRIHHVWLHGGREAARVSLPIGGPRWRTQSAKLLHPGSQGSWSVEARDGAGRVLARSTFRCTR